MGEDLGVRQAGGERRAHGLDVAAGSDLDQHVGGLVGGGVDQRARRGERGEHVGQGGEGADAVGDGADGHLGVVDLGLVAGALDAELVEVGIVDGDGGRRGKRGDAALGDVPRQRAALGRIGADQQGRGGAAAALAPVDEADRQLLHAGDAGCGEDRVPLAAGEQGRVVEALGAVGHDPQVGGHVVEHGRDAVLGAEVEAELHGHQDHGEDDADQGDGEAQPVVEEVAVGELGDHRHGRRRRAGLIAQARHGRVEGVGMHLHDRSSKLAFRVARR